MKKVVNAYKNRSRCNTFLRACVGLAGSLNNVYVIFLFQTHLTHLQARLLSRNVSLKELRLIRMEQLAGLLRRKIFRVVRVSLGVCVSVKNS